MSSRRGVPLKDRPVWTGQSQQPGPPVQTTAPAARRRHCWLTLPDHDGEVEALVLQWAAEPTGWVALTIYVIDRPGGSVAIQEWIPAARLRPDR